jgi:hypothetical protein
MAGLFDKFHVMRYLGEALDALRKSEYARLEGRQRRYIKGQKYTLLSRRENLSTAGRRSASCSRPTSGSTWPTCCKSPSDTRSVMHEAWAIQYFALG